MLKNVLIHAKVAKNNHEMILIFNYVMCIFFSKKKGIQQNISNG